MKRDLRQYCIEKGGSVREALQMLDALAGDAVIFLVEDGKLCGSISDGDIRRGLIQGYDLQDPLPRFATQSAKFLRAGEFNLADLRVWRSSGFKIIPVVEKSGKIVKVLNFREQRSYLPLHAVIMAGGKGLRLRPLTLETPKPLLKVGDKPIVEYNVDRLANYGVDRITMTVSYLGEQIIRYFKNGDRFGLPIDYVEEAEPRGTIGAVTDIRGIDSDYVLVMNSDLLTTVDFEEMMAEMLEQDADMIVGTVPYEVKVPYGVVETEGNNIIGLREKPTYTYYSNAGIYIFRKDAIARIPREGVYNATDLMRDLYSDNKRVIQFPILGYWLDVGKPADFERAQRDIEHISL